MGHSCALRGDATMTCWGNNDFGQADAPAGAFTASEQSCGLRTGGTITCWGLLQARIGVPSG